MQAKIVAVVGNTAVGKTTLVRELRRRFALQTGLEQHVERPYQRHFLEDRRGYALANQVDYLLFRAEQERSIRQSDAVGLLDGGLDQDFHVFTRLFRDRGYLDADGYALCERLYRFVRAVLPPPELFVWLRAPVQVGAGRFETRHRPLSIATQEDMPALERHLEHWLTSSPGSRVRIVDAAADGPGFENAIAALRADLLALGVRELGDAAQAR